MPLSFAQIIKQLQTYRAPITDDKFRMTGDFQRFLYSFIDGSETVEAAAATAQTDLEVNNVSVESLSQLAVSDSAGVWPADSTTDHVLTFKRQGVSIATHTIRSVFTQSTGFWTVTSHAETLEATTEVISGSGGRDAKAVVTHTGSGIIGKVTIQATDQSSATTSPSK